MNASLAAGPISRIALRYLVGWAAGKGLIASGAADVVSTDPDILFFIEAGVTVAVASAIEGWYWIAKRWGRPT